MLACCLIDVEVGLSIVDDDRCGDVVETAKGFADVETGIETGGLVEAGVVWDAIDVALTEGFFEGVAGVVDGAEETPLNEFEVLVDMLFEQLILTELILTGDVLAVFEV